MMDRVARIDMLLFASTCICSAVAVMAIPSLSFRPGPLFFRARLSLLLLFMAVVLILWASSSLPVARVGSLDSEHERILVWLTPFFCVVALASLILMILALRHRFFPSRYRGDEDEYEPW
jgi:hypothetical protein